MSETNEWFMHSDGSAPWTRREVEKILGENFVGYESGTHKIQCVLAFDHKAANLAIDTGGIYVKSFKYSCRLCRDEDQLTEDDQSQLFVNWLTPQELVDGRWFPHSNPLDEDHPSAELAFRRDVEGAPLLYRGAVHFVYGKPGTFKSWFAISTFLDGDVRLWDFENGMSPTRSRLEALGVTRDKTGGYTSPQSETEVLSRVKEYIHTKPDIVCIDGFSGLSGIMNVNPDSNTDVLRVYTQVLYPLKQAGITVVVLDHLPKDGASDDYPIGAQAKKAQSDVALLFKNAKQDGQVDIYVSKDRHGLLYERAEQGTSIRKLGTMSLVQEGQNINIEVKPAYSASIGNDSIRSTEAQLMQAVFEYISQNPKCNKNQIERGVLGKTEYKRRALERLIENEVVTQEAVGTSFIHTVKTDLNLSWTPLGQ